MKRKGKEYESERKRMRTRMKNKEQWQIIRKVGTKIIRVPKRQNTVPPTSLRDHHAPYYSLPPQHRVGHQKNSTQPSTGRRTVCVIVFVVAIVVVVLASLL